MGQLMENIEESITISEPDAILNIADMNRQRQMSHDQACDLIKVVVTLMLYHAEHCQPNGIKVKFITVKTRSQCYVLIPMLEEMFPKMTHLFMYRYTFKVVPSITY